jgi:hypothetical protein
MFMKVNNVARGSDNPVVFVDDEAHARAWIAKRRAELAGRPRVSP